MSHKKQILILTASVGNGHQSASRATLEAIKEIKNSKVSVEVLDFNSFCSPVLDAVIQKNYKYTSNYMPQIQKFIYEVTNKESRVKFLNLLLEKTFFREIEKLIQVKKPNIIISTFPLWDYAIRKISKKIISNSSFFTIITDAISVHRSWILADTDFFFVSNADTKETLLNMGIKEDKIKDFGFPVHADFARNFSRDSFLKSINLNPNRFTVLFQANFISRGAFNYISSLREDLPNLNFIVLTGKNKKLLKKFPPEKNLVTLGWREDMARIMKSADMMITKAGGASIMEGIAAELPLLITRVIPGQEEGNLVLVRKNNLGLASFNLDLTRQIIKRWSKKKEDFQEIKRNLKSFARPKAAYKIAKFVLSQAASTSPPSPQNDHQSRQKASLLSYKCRVP